MYKLSIWQSIFLIIFIFIGALLAGIQTVFIAWISSFPERTADLASLAIKFYCYFGLSVFLVIVDIVLFRRLIKRVNDKNRS